MPASEAPQSLFVWTWLPGKTNPVVAGRLVERPGRLDFVYGESYLRRTNAISLYSPELPLRAGVTPPLPGLDMPGCIRDGSPDAWGRRVIDSRLGVGDFDLTELRYLIESGSNRFGALDFQTSPTQYVPRDETATLDELHEAAIMVDDGRPLPQPLAEALIRGTSIGGARPKALLVDSDGTQWIAKFSSSSDTHFSVPNAEGATMILAQHAGIDVCEVRVTSSLGREILLVRRFDRTSAGGRIHAVSALTMSGEGELGARYVTYPQILAVLERHSGSHEPVGPALFRRIVFNVAVSNSDDHARNHAALWDGTHLRLSPAYDLCPGPRSGQTAQQAMAFGRSGIRTSTFAACISVAAEYGLRAHEARAVVDEVASAISDHFHEAADEARMSSADRKAMLGRQFLNPGALHGMPTSFAVPTPAGDRCGAPRASDGMPCRRLGKCPYH